MPDAVPHSYVLAARLLAAAGVVQALIYLLFGFDGFEPWLRVPVAAWIAAPLVLAYGAAMKLVPSRKAFGLVLLAMAMALAVSVWAYFEITWGETARRESLAGLLFLFGPLYQYGLFVPVLALAWIMHRRERAS